MKKYTFRHPLNLNLNLILCLCLSLNLNLIICSEGSRGDQDTFRVQQESCFGSFGIN